MVKMVVFMLYAFDHNKKIGGARKSNAAVLNPKMETQIEFPCYSLEAAFFFFRKLLSLLFLRATFNRLDKTHPHYAG